jgi:hypothetical protein
MGNTTNSLCGNGRRFFLMAALAFASPAPILAFDVAELDRNGSALDLNFQSQTSISYRVELMTNLLTGWAPVAGVVPGTGSATAVSIASTGQLSVAFYRVALESAVVSFQPAAGQLTNGTSVSVQLDLVPGVLASNRTLVVELVDSNGTVHGTTSLALNPTSGTAQVNINLSVNHDLPDGDHTWTLRAFIGSATGTWSTDAARWNAAVAVKVFPLFLSTQGRNIVDPLNRTVPLRGVNLGAWLVYEDWMLKFAPAWVNEFSVREWLAYKSLGGTSFPAFEAERYDARRRQQRRIRRQLRCRRLDPFQRARFQPGHPRDLPDARRRSIVRGTAD